MPRHITCLTLCHGAFLFLYGLNKKACSLFNLKFLPEAKTILPLAKVISKKIGFLG